ncbi:MAG: OmpA family protein [Alphaproteobacteria bacterium]|nr:OmpA family protein [Alphaproteobacteria bacterium]
MAAVLVVSAGCAEVPPPASPAPAAAVDWSVFFEHDSTAISATGVATIRNAAQYARQSIKPRITLTGHTDRSGGAAYNMGLSLRRAEAVKKALVAQGIPADAIEARGLGESQPLVMTPDGVREPQNNRVEFTIQ